MQSLAQQRIVIMGGSSGIGLAAVQQAAAQGAEVWCLGRSQERLDKLKEELPDNVNLVPMDTHDQSALAAFFNKLGSIDHLVSAATGAQRTIAPYMEMTEDQYSAAFDKFWGYNRIIRAAVPHLNPRGSICLVSGTPARKAKINMSSISSVGAAVEALVRSLALELAPKRVNVVAPGVIETGMFDWAGDNKAAMLEQIGKNILLGRVGQADEVAAAIIMLLQNPYATGTTIDIDGGDIIS